MTDSTAPSFDRRRFALSGLALGATALGAGCASSAATPVAPMAPAPMTPVAQAAGPVVLAGVSPRLTIHCLDTYHGTPAAGLKVDFSVFDGAKFVLVKTIDIAANGRAKDDPVLVGDAYRPGRYQFLLHVDAYFAMTGATLPKPPFFSALPVDFQVVNAAERIHVPIQFGPWSYTYSRGS